MTAAIILSRTDTMPVYNHELSDEVHTPSRYIACFLLFFYYLGRSIVLFCLRFSAPCFVQHHVFPSVSVTLFDTALQPQSGLLCLFAAQEPRNTAHWTAQHGFPRGTRIMAATDLKTTMPSARTEHGPDASKEDGTTGPHGLALYVTSYSMLFEPPTRKYRPIITTSRRTRSLVLRHNCSRNCRELSLACTCWDTYIAQTTGLQDTAHTIASLRPRSPNFSSADQTCSSVPFIPCCIRIGMPRHRRARRSPSPVVTIYIDNAGLFFSPARSPSYPGIPLEVSFRILHADSLSNRPRGKHDVCFRPVLLWFRDTPDLLSWNAIGNKSEDSQSIRHLSQPSTSFQKFSYHGSPDHKTT
ncbi:hypothetical protein B0T19DRAFT_140954 [Cercophora scortea]|uniref:Uncharacterized protein n=1 Tax=Cercophora scortea TaxID=314031 RepID=A0AAE0IZ71_9PEZI|nr:hypothetical protein B0T19DRAFT_140954 [Cercophora scortea]